MRKGLPGEGDQTTKAIALIKRNRSLVTGKPEVIELLLTGCWLLNLQGFPASHHHTLPHIGNSSCAFEPDIPKSRILNSFT